MKPSLKILLFSLLTAILLCGCRSEEFNTMESIPIIAQTGNLIEGSVTGFISDVNDVPVSDALIDLNGATTHTDENGLFSIPDTQLNAAGTFLKVYADGYMIGSRRFYPYESETTEVRIKLISKEAIKSVPTQTGGIISINDAVVELPSGTYIDESGNAYEGEVFVAARWLDPTLPESYQEMPGDLIGLDADANLTRLTSYGMMVVEVMDEIGNTIRLPNGSKSKLSFPIPDEIIASAPSTIPLWNFSQELGYWIEEGEANLVNGFYQGEVSHFSFWNCDVPTEQVKITGNIIVNDLQQSTSVIIKDLSTGISKSTYTNQDGRFSMFVPIGKDLEMKIFNICDVLLETSQIGSFDVDAQIGPFQVDGQLGTSQLEGNVETCLFEGWEFGWVTVFDGSKPRTSVVADEEGNFNLVNDVLCEEISGTLCVTDFANFLVHDGITITQEDLLNSMEIDLCALTINADDIKAAFYYKDIDEWGYTPALFPTFGIETIEDIDGVSQTVIEGDIMTWMNSETVTFRYHFVDGSNMATFEIDMIDFKVTGQCNLINTSNSKRIWGNSSDIEIINTNIEPDDIPEFHFVIAQ